MFRTNLRELLVRDELDAEEDTSPLAPGQVRPLRGSGLPIYEKGANVPVYVIGEGGETIICITKTKRVIVPLVQYPIGEKGETAVQERIVALIEAVVSGPSMTKVPLEHVEKHLRKSMKHPLYAVLADETVVMMLVKAGMKDVAIYVSPLPLGRRIYGLPEPKQLGHLAMHRSQCTQSIMVHGIPLGIEVQLEDVPFVELATPRELGQVRPPN